MRKIVLVRNGSLFSFVLLIVALRLVLDLGYVSLISPKFYYAGLNVEINQIKVLLSYVILILVAFIVRHKELSPSSFGLALLTIFILVPISSLWALSNQRNGMMVIVTLSILVVRLMISGKTLKLPKIKDGKQVFLVFAIFLMLAFIIPLILKGGLNHFKFSLDGLYARREFFTTNLIGGLSGYFMIWFAKIINPALIAYFLLKRKYYVVLLLVALQLVEFSITTFKGHLLYPLVVFFVFYFVSKRFDIREVFLFGMVSLVSTFFLIGIFLQNELAIGLVSRAFYSVAQNHFEYYLFFQDNDFVVWSNSILRFFNQYEYDKPIAAIIGYGRYGRGIETFANAGYIASGYSQFGVAGVLLYSMILGVILKLFDGLGKNVPIALSLSISSIAILQLVNSDLTTAILTHGIMLAMLVLFLLGSTSWFLPIRRPRKVSIG